MIKHALYYSQYCFFCQKVLMFLRRREYQIDLRSTSERENHQMLMCGGGKTQVPCLLIESESGDSKWMYESDDIIKYLKEF